LGTFDVARGLLDADDAWHLGQPHHGIVLQIGHCAPWHVVENDGQLGHSLGNGLEVLVQPFLGGLVVVGHHLQLGIGTDFVGKTGQFNRFSRRIGAATGNDGDAFGRLLDRDADDFAVFIHGDRGRFTRGPHHHNRIGALGHMPVDQFSQARVIHLAVCKHGGDQGRNAATDGAKFGGHVQGFGAIKESF